MLSKEKAICAFMICSCLALAGCQNGQLDLSKANIGTGLGAAAGGLLGSQVGGGTGKIIATGAGVLVGGLVGRQIGSYLDEQDRQKASIAAQQAVVTGRSQSWSGDKGVSGQAKVVKTETRKRAVSVPVLKDRVAQVPPLDLIGEPYRATAAANVRGGPGGDYKSVAKLAAEETVMVAGKVQGKNWYLISQDGAGSGFVSADLLAKAPSGSMIADNSAATGPVESQTVETSRTCRTIQQTITLASGETRSEDVTACQGPNGWETVPA